MLDKLREAVQRIEEWSGSASVVCRVREGDDLIVLTREADKMGYEIVLLALDEVVAWTPQPKGGQYLDD